MRKPNLLIRLFLINVLRLHEVAMNQDQAFTNINKTFNELTFQFLINPEPRHLLKPLLPAGLLHSCIFFR